MQSDNVMYNASFIKSIIVTTVMYTINVKLFSFFFQASGGTDKIIHLWNAVTCIHLHTFKGHKDAVSVSHVICVLLLNTVIIKM